MRIGKMSFMDLQNCLLIGNQIQGKNEKRGKVAFMCMFFTIEILKLPYT